MANFIENLWESVFVGGITPTLLLATNATFGALLVLLLTMLAATRSVHFVFLSALTGALWASINWFAAELISLQQAEAEKSAEDTDSATISNAADGSDERGQAAETTGAVTTEATSTSTRQRHMQQAVDSIGDSMDSDWEQVDSER